MITIGLAQTNNNMRRLLHNEICAIFFSYKLNFTSLTCKVKIFFSQLIVNVEANLQIQLLHLKSARINLYTLKNTNEQHLFLSMKGCVKWMPLFFERSRIDLYEKIDR